MGSINAMSVKAGDYIRLLGDDWNTSGKVYYVVSADYHMSEEHYTTRVDLVLDYGSQITIASHYIEKVS